MAAAADVLLFGATGFTGRRVARRLAQRAPAGLELVWCGRDRERLEQLAGELGRGRIAVADAADAVGLRRAVDGARVVLSTAGPFARLGDGLVDACAEAGRHYADITGEVAWVRRLIERHHGAARARGTFLVPCCGFDSVPADLGVLALVEEARRRGFGDLASIWGVYRLRGGLNGGSWATLIELARAEDRRLLADPYLLVPGYEPSAAELRRQADPAGPEREPGSGATLMPFFMGPINRRVVMRSDALLGYGAALCYREYQALEGAHPLAAQLASGALRWLSRGLSTALGQQLARRFGPLPGQGPDERTIEHGRVRLDLHATAVGGQTLGLRLEASGDPGNAVTSRCLVECGLLLADPSAVPTLGQPGHGGLLTPASAFGLPLLTRLANQGDFTLTFSAA